MSLKKIRRRLSHTFRITVDGSLSELAEHLTIGEDGNPQYLTITENGEPRENGNATNDTIMTACSVYHLY